MMKRILCAIALVVVVAALAVAVVGAHASTYTETAQIDSASLQSPDVLVFVAPAAGEYLSASFATADVFTGDPYTLADVYVVSPSRGLPFALGFVIFTDGACEWDAFVTQDGTRFTSILLPGDRVYAGLLSSTLDAADLPITVTVKWSNAAATPEPQTLLLFGSGGFCLLLVRRLVACRF